MMTRLLIATPLIFALLACDAKQNAETNVPEIRATTSTSKSTESAQKPSTREELLERARKRHGREPTMLDLFDEAVHEAKHAVGGIKEPGQPRIVKKGMTPELIISGEQITYNGKPLVMGANLRDWEDILGHPSRRDDIKPPALLVWDELGFDVMGDKKNKVTQIKIYVNKRPKDPYGEMTVRPDGTPVEPSIDFSPKKAFSGYLEMDGFGIDAETKFWEVVKTANSNRNIHCPLRDCSHPGGSMGENSGSIYFILNRGDENGNIYEMSISSQ